MGYLEDLAAWQAECDRITAEHAAAQAAYDALNQAYLADKAAWDTKSAAFQQYPTDLATKITEIKNSVAPVVESQVTIILGTWPGPWGYLGNLSTWMNTTKGALPQSVTDPHGWIRNRMNAAQLSTLAWDAHVGLVHGLEWLFLNVPADPGLPPEAPTPPSPPVYPPKPEPPVTQAADYVADTTGFTIEATGVRKATVTPLKDLWGLMQPGQVAEFTGGIYKRLDARGVAQRPPGSAPITFRAAAGGRPLLHRDASVGGSNALFLGPGCADTIWDGFDIEVDDTAGVKTATGTKPRHVFKNCRIFGYFDPTTPNAGKDDSKWGLHLYETSGWLLEDCEVFGVYGEHAWYDHNRQGNVTWKRVKIRHCQRTAYQDVSRQNEGKVGIGNVTLEDVDIEDVCLESGGGGSALTFRGGCPTSEIRLTHVKVRLGCNPKLAAPFNQNITGALLVDSGQYAYPGGVKHTHLKQCDFEVGTVYPGVNQAKRSNVKVEVGDLTIEDTRIWGGTNGIALEITTPGTVRFIGTNTVQGKILYLGQPYTTLAELQAAHPGLFV